MIPDRFVELGTQFLNGVLLGSLFIRLKPQLPIPFDDRLVLGSRQPMTRLQLMDAVYDALTRRSGTVGPDERAIPTEAPVDLGSCRIAFSSEANTNRPATVP
jgi:hypothetical protein